MSTRLVLLTALLASCTTREPAATPNDGTPMGVVAEPTDGVAPLHPDAGEGARAEREEGKTGGKGAPIEEARDGQNTGDAGLLGSLEGARGSDLHDVLGASGPPISGGGLETRGIGLGGGGSAEALGGIGTRGIGSGKSGYGRGGGSLGSKGVDGLVAPGRPAEPVALGTEHYTDYGVNGYTLTESDAQSTFSIDVDTASFAIARRYLDDGALPPRDAVRVEEFVNAQKYTYEPPDDAPFAANLEAAPDPFRAGHHLVRIGVKAAEPTVDRDPVHLTFLVDVSGSMASTPKLPLAKRALHHLVDHLEGEDRVALVTYAGSTRVLLPPTRVGDEAAIHRAIDSLRTGGGTHMDSGMHLAYDLALQSLEPGTENRVIVLSDGDANIGRTSHEQILASLAGYAKKGITMSTIGFGRGNYRDTLMEQLANKGDGNYYYIDSFKEAQKVFGTDLASTVQTVARDVKLQVEFDPRSVLSYRLIGYENRDIADRDFRNDRVDAGEIGSGHTVTALYDVILRDEPVDTLATLLIRSKPPGPDAPAIERATPLPTSAIKGEFADATRDFRIAYTAAMFAEILRGSPYAEEIDYAAVARMGRDARRNTEDDALVGLIEKAGRLSHTDGVASR